MLYFLTYNSTYSISINKKDNLADVYYHVLEEIGLFWFLLKYHIRII